MRRPPFPSRSAASALRSYAFISSRRRDGLDGSEIARPMPHFLAFPDTAGLALNVGFEREHREPNTSTTLFE